MRNIHITFLAFLLVVSTNAYSDTGWPREISLDNGVRILMYQPQPERLNGNKLVSRSVVSVRKSKSDEPVFGVVWTEATLLTDKDTRMTTLDEIKVTHLKFPDVKDSSKLQALTTILEAEIPRWKLDVHLDEIVATLEQEQKATGDDLSTEPPQVIYRTEPTTLILIDGDPVVKMDDKLKMERVLNTPFLMVKNPDDKKFYLYAGSLWYASPSIEKGWSAITALPSTIKTLDTEIKKQDQENQKKATEAAAPATSTAILISTKPAELIQTKGEAAFASIQGTSLLYITNSEDDIFKCVEDQQYYILLAGRWYIAATLKGPWNYLAPDKLPADFAKIPEGSDKDVVLANVAGTDAAREAVIDAQIPQTAKVDRNSTSCTVTYDGEPKFEAVEGTSLYVAVNTAGTVIRANNKYYAVDNGVWFVSGNATGPWTVSTERPSDVDKIPPSNKAYNTKYVYVYESSPEYVYVGYTPGYMGCYVYGPTVVYGTGFYYPPWYGAMFFPGPITWGFGMHYNPWYGWGMSVGYSAGFFAFGMGMAVGAACWFGPPVFMPPFRPVYRAGYGGYYGAHVSHYSNVNVNINHSNNVYNNRNDVNTRDVQRGQSGSNANRGASASTRDNPGNRASTGNISQNRGTSAGNTAQNRSASNRNSDSPRSTNKASNNVYSDRSGNVYQKGSSGDWQQRNNGSWQSSSGNRQSSASQMDRSSQQRDRGNMRSSQATQSRPSGGGYRGGGGGRGGGGRR
jgi:hypothetical protein